jgi:hypothetical protein
MFKKKKKKKDHIIKINILNGLISSTTWLYHSLPELFPLLWSMVCIFVVWFDNSMNVLLFVIGTVILIMEGYLVHFFRNVSYYLMIVSVIVMVVSKF